MKRKKSPPAEKKSRLIQYGQWTLVYMYQFAVINPVLAVVIALLILALFGLGFPIIISKLFFI